MPDQRFTRDLRKLTQASHTSFRQSNLARSTTAPSQPGGLGVGKKAQAAGLVQASGAAISDAIERVLAYSTILVQEEGVFELPPGWPGDNTYPGFSFLPSELPVLGAPFLTQRRVHEVVYTSVDDIHNTGYTKHLLAYEKPFTTTDLIKFPVPVGKFRPAVAILQDVGSFNSTTAEELFDHIARVTGLYV